MGIAKQPGELFDPFRVGSGAVTVRGRCPRLLYGSPSGTASVDLSRHGSPTFCRRRGLGLASAAGGFGSGAFEGPEDHAQGVGVKVAAG